MTYHHGYGDDDNEDGDAIDDVDVYDGEPPKVSLMMMMVMGALV